MTTLDRDGVDIAPPAAPRTAVLDSAHVGDIEGALGRISVGDTDRPRTLKVRLVTLLAIIGPGMIVMVGDNDAGGVATYAQAGQNYGYSLLWVLLLLIPVLIVNQEMVVRLGAVTGVGHARLINERFGRGWGWFSVGDLFLLNFLTLVTEFIGITLAADYIGIPRYLVVPFAAIALIAIMATGSFRRWERAMFVFIAITLLQIPMLLMCSPRIGVTRRNPLCARRVGWRDHLGRGAADHCHRRHHGGTVAAVLPAVQRRRQAHHAALHRLRASRHRARRLRRGGRRGSVGDDRRLGRARHQQPRQFHRRRRGRTPARPTQITCSARSSRSCC